MADDYEREGDRERDERRAARRCRMRRRDDGYESSSSERPVSVLGVVALVKGIFALVASLIPCLGMLVIPAGVLALILALLSIAIARSNKQAMGFPIAATAVSSAAIAASLMWLVLFSAMFRNTEERAAMRPVPPPPIVVPQGPPQPAPPPNAKSKQKDPEPKITDEQFEQQLLADLAKDRIKEAIRNGPGIAVTATDLEDAFNTNAVSADLKFKDKVLAVTGKVIRVVRDESKAVYTLELATGDATKTVSCDFTEQTKHPLASVERGKQVTVRGQCVGRVNEFVKLKDCVVVK